MSFYKSVKPVLINDVAFLRKKRLNYIFDPPTINEGISIWKKMGQNLTTNLVVAQL